MLLLISTALLVGVNWLIYIWAVNSNHMLDASLGYYINPLLNVMLGLIFLGERLRKMQWFAVALATCGVAIQVIIFGSIPIVAIALALTFGSMDCCVKKSKSMHRTGLFIETLVMLPAAAIYLLWIADSATSDPSLNTVTLNMLLICAGIVTTPPTLLYWRSYSPKALYFGIFSVYRSKLNVFASSLGLR